MGDQPTDDKTSLSDNAQMTVTAMMIGVIWVEATSSQAQPTALRFQLTTKLSGSQGLCNSTSNAQLSAPMAC